MITKNVGFPLKKGGIFPSSARQLIPFQTAAMTNAAKNPGRYPEHTSNQQKEHRRMEY